MTKKGFLMYMVLCTIILGACDSKKNDPQSPSGSDEYVPYDETQHFEYLTIGDFIPFCGFPVPVICQKMEKIGYALVEKNVYENGRIHYYFISSDAKEYININAIKDSVEYIEYNVSNRGMTPKTARLWINQMERRCLLPTNAKMLFWTAQFADFDERYSFRYDTDEYDYFQNVIQTKVVPNHGIWCKWFNVGYTQYPDIRDIILTYSNRDGIDYGSITINFIIRH